MRSNRSIVEPVHVGVNGKSPLSKCLQLTTMGSMRSTATGAMTPQYLYVGYLAVSSRKHGAFAPGAERYANSKPDLCIGSSRIRLPVAKKIAFTCAGMTGRDATSPNLPGM